MKFSTDETVNNILLNGEVASNKIVKNLFSNKRKYYDGKKKQAKKFLFETRFKQLNVK